MQLFTRRLSAALRSCSARVHYRSRDLSTSTLRVKLQPLGGGLLNSPWSAAQFRGARFSGGDVKPGNVIERRGKVYEVIKAQHSTQGRGGAIIQVELRDVDSGNKLNERLRTDEPVENYWRADYEVNESGSVCTIAPVVDHTFPKPPTRGRNILWEILRVITDFLDEFKYLGHRGLRLPKIHVQEKKYEYLYTDDGDTGNVFLMDPKTYEQLDVPPHLFGESLVFLQEDMEVTVQLYDNRPLSASIPTRATCTIVEAAEALKGSGTPPYKRASLDNGVTVQVPAHIVAGDRVIINTTDGSYVGRA